MSQALRENTYPFLAMIMLKDRKMTVVGRLEGLIQPEDLINQLTFIMEANQTYLMSERLERYTVLNGSRRDGPLVGYFLDAGVGFLKWVYMPFHVIDLFSNTIF